MTKTLQERAREWLGARAYEAPHEVNALTQLLEAVRAEALEEAAKSLEVDNLIPWTGEQHAKRIRALKSPKPTP